MMVAMGNLRLVLFVVLIFALMLLMIVHGGNNVVRNVNSLVAGGRLYALDTDERNELENQISALLKTARIDKPLRINSRYDSESLNVYVTVADQSNPSVTKGNSAFVKSKDILFIDNAHFLFGQRRIFDSTSHEAEAPLFAALRAYTVFVLAHELCHREAHTGRWLPHSDHPEEEYAADSCAMTLLYSLYGSGASVWTGATLKTDQASSDPTPDLEAVQPYFRDLLHGLNFIATDLLDNNFPVVSGGEAHPIFFERMRRVVDQMERLFAGRASVLGAQSIEVTRVVMKAASNVLALGPSTIEFDNPIDYALLGKSDLIYFDRADPVPHRIEFRRVAPLAVLRVHNSASDAEPMIRYAWLNADGTIGMLRVDRNLASVNASSGKIIATRDVTREFGDNSCVKRAEIARAPVSQVYFMYCVSSSPMVRVLAGRILGEQISLNEVAKTALARNLGTDQTPDFKVLQVSVGSKGDVGLFIEQAGKVYLVECDSNLNAKRVALLAAEPPLNSDEQLPARLNLQTWQYLQADNSLAFTGSWLFRKVRAELVSGSPTTVFAASDLTPDLNDGRIDAPIPIINYQYLQTDRTVVNLRDGGVYLLNLSKRTILPISYFSQTHMEQMQGNDSGDWDVHQKHGQRILLFQSERNIP
jgi:hypothetical protein